MSEANNVWRVDPAGQEREIEVEHSTMTGKFSVKLDGTVVQETRLFARKKPVDFNVDGHSARVTVDYKYGGFGAQSTLHLDDRYVEPLRR